MSIVGADTVATGRSSELGQILVVKHLLHGSLVGVLEVILVTDKGSRSVGGSHNCCCRGGHFQFFPCLRNLNGRGWGTGSEIGLDLGRGRKKSLAMAASPTPAGAPTVLLLLLASPAPATARETNKFYEPCADTIVQRSDWFNFEIAFASHDSFFFTNKSQSVQLSPCNHQLTLLNGGTQLHVFRPKDEEISLLTINTTTLSTPTVRVEGTWLHLLVGSMLRSPLVPVLPWF